MRKAFLLYLLPALFSSLLLYISYQALLLTDMTQQNIEIDIEIEGKQNSELQFFVEEAEEFHSENMQKCKVPENAHSIHVKFDLPDLKHPGRIRIDPGLTMGKWFIKKISL